MKAIDETSLRNMPKSRERHAAALQEFYRARRERAEEISQQRKKVRYSLPYLSALLDDFDSAYLANILNGRRAFSLPPAQLAVFCYYVYHKSCHEFLFGHTTAAMLPKVLSGAVKLFQELSEHRQQELLTLMKSWMKHDIRNDTDSTQEQTLPEPRDPVVRKIFETDHTRLVKRRIMEAAYDRILQPVDIFGTPVVEAIRNSVQSYLIKMDGYYAKTNTLMYFALCLDTAIDQFCVVDYTEKTAVKFFGTHELVTDQTAIEFIRTYLILQDEEEANEAKILQKVMIMTLEKA